MRGVGVRFRVSRTTPQLEIVKPQIIRQAFFLFDESLALRLVLGRRSRVMLVLGGFVIEGRGNWDVMLLCTAQGS